MASRLIRKWESYLYAQHRLVALDPWSDMKLFTVLLKKQGEGKNKPVLVKIGSIDSLREPLDDSDDEEEWQNFVEDKEEENIVETRLESDIEFSTDRESKVLLKIVEMLGGGAGASKGLHLKVKDVRSERVRDEAVAALFSERRPLWVPDLPIIRRKYDGCYNKKDSSVEIWLVTEIKYCKEILVASTYSAFLNLVVRSDVLVTGTGVSMKVDSKGDDKLFISGENIPLGFKAIKLVYDGDGRLCTFFQMGQKKPEIERSSMQLKPDENPWYHMGDLFHTNIVQHIHEEDDDLDCIDIVDN